jgi:hypothetical protein
VSTADVTATGSSPGVSIDGSERLTNGGLTMTKRATRATKGCRVCGVRLTKENAYRMTADDYLISICKECDKASSVVRQNLYRFGADSEEYTAKYRQRERQQLVNRLIIEGCKDASYLTLLWRGKVGCDGKDGNS